MLQNNAAMYLYEKYTITLPGTNIHWVTCIIIFFELAMFIYQLIYYLARPSDKTRLWHLLFLAAFIQYNILGGIFIDPTITSIPLFVQDYIETCAGTLALIYFPFYIYKGLGIKELKFFTKKESLFFVFFLILTVFTPIYILTGNREKAFIYFTFSALGFVLFYLYKVIRVLIKVLKDTAQDRFFKEKFLATTLSLVSWIVGAAITNIFNLSQQAEHLLLNIGVIIMTVVFVKSAVIELRKEHTELQNMNALLEQKVLERTTRLENTFKQKSALFLGLTHETRTPLTLIGCYLQQHMAEYGTSRPWTLCGKIQTS
jgi:signal transduction histidine kinase